MDLDTLKREAERLRRSAQLLSQDESGALAGWYYETPVRGVHFALLRGDEVLLVRTKGKGGGSVSIDTEPPTGGTKLYARPWESLPPIEALFLRGSDNIGQWLAQNDWKRSWGFNDNFGDSALVHDYEAWWQSEHPFYKGEGFGIAGGWHFVWPDEDWHDRVEDELVFWTLQGKPWIEVWLSGGHYNVIERVT